MPKLGMAPLRRKQLIDAAIASIHEYGLADATVSRIARKAGVSSGIVHHYFDDKDDLLFATMGTMLEALRVTMAARLKVAKTPKERLEAIIDANFDDTQFSPGVMSAWLALYGSARQSVRLTRILTLYHRRLHSNLVHACKQLVPAGQAERLAHGVAAMIDGLWLRCALSRDAVDPKGPRTLTHEAACAMLDAFIRQGGKLYD